MKFTIVIKDASGPALNPLIYTINMPCPRANEYGRDDVWDEDAKAAIAKQIKAETGDEWSEDEIELLFAFAGDISPVADWRE